MNKMIAPSLMCAHVGELSKTLDIFAQTGIEYLHIDVMDGVFVQNLQIGTEMIRQIREMSDIPLDIHLMITRPENKLSWFGIREGDYVSVHYEATDHVQRCLSYIRDAGGRAMLALNPATPLCVLENVLDDCDAILLMTVNPGFAGQKIIPSTIDKTHRLRRMLDDNGYGHIKIEVDGNVSFETAPLLSEAGADIFVAGTSSVFTKSMPFADAIGKLRRCIEI